jgi:3-oxoadipate enol-lactonase
MFRSLCIRENLERAVNPSTGFAEVNRTRLWFEKAGAGPPVLLIHGSPLDARMWDEQVSAFSAQHRVVRYDVRGYGRSALPGDVAYRHEEDLAALLALLGIERAAILGSSMGGRLAVDFALAYPEAVSALVLAGSSLSGFPWSDDPVAETAEVVNAWRDAGPMAAKRLMMGKHWFATARPRPAVTRQLEQIIGDYSGWHWFHQDPVSEPRPPAYERLEAVTAPTLAIVGAQDTPDIHKVTAAVATRIPGAQCETFPNAGHMVNMEEPEWFNRVVIDFLAGFSSEAKSAEMPT